ncbi:cytochrome C oxidase subunit I [Halobacteriales archaeon QS_9_68_17]|nr:MAG: cytochrome C oxidase subunit I [Halobacteriales archaeon QS_9_68_17]
MSSEQSEAGSIPAEESAIAEEIPITPRLIGTSMTGGLVGMVLMLPLLAGIPIVLDVFRTEPILEFASFATIVGLEPSLIAGMALFGLGGTLFLPVQFLVVGAFLPPDSPRFLRGVSFALIYWIGFMLAFWPGGSLLAIGLFILVSFLSHVMYGLSLGYLTDRWAEIPQHAV